MKIKLKSRRQNVFFLLVALKMCITFGQSERVKKIIVIDPGHGGLDSGAIGVHGILEKDVVLNISKAILELNKTVFDDEFDMYLTRYSDTLISLSDRSRLAKTLKTEVFISIHCNASKRTARGMEVFVYHSKHDTVNFNVNESVDLGLSVLNESTQELGSKNRNVKFANFQVLRETIPHCLSILVETGFVTNPDEAYYFSKPKNINAVALGILLGLYNYLNIKL
jgi:N-acetylmuramoyl-L-alanine amidase